MVCLQPLRRLWEGQSADLSRRFLPGPWVMRTGAKTGSLGLWAWEAREGEAGPE